MKYKTLFAKKKIKKDHKKRVRLRSWVECIIMQENN